jgi:hypothetical protein
MSQISTLGLFAAVASGVAPLHDRRARSLQEEAATRNGRLVSSNAPLIQIPIQVPLQIPIRIRVYPVK